MTRVLLTILAAALSSSACYATSITYTLSTTASGTLDGHSFTSAPVTVTLTGDTAGIATAPLPNPPVPVNPGTATVDVSGIGTDTFTDSIVIVSTLNYYPSFGFPGPAVVIFDNTSQTGIVLQTGSVFSTYGLDTSLGPIFGSGGVASGSSVTPVFPTEGGELTWAVGQSLGESTFTAVTTTPEPATLALVGSGLAAVLTRRCFKTRRPS